jgi:uncharacterized protein (DUF488 family)
LVVHTLGHSTRPLADFLAVLATHGITGIVDVRRFPASRRHPHFAREALARVLEDGGRRYEWLEALGGRREPLADSPHVAWRNASFRAYADHMDGEVFRRGLEHLVALAAERPTAVLCAEAVPWRCHRQLIADALVARGIEVRHAIGHEPPALHRLTSFARLEGSRLVYDVGHLPIPPAVAASRRRRDRP